MGDFLRRLLYPLILPSIVAAVWAAAWTRKYDALPPSRLPAAPAAMIEGASDPAPRPTRSTYGFSTDVNDADPVASTDETP